ncbi:hypothetical protein MKEN_00996300 [Mycena kentingensis (nom. inval.)]|nr:hypothetical protein MKEN_00996300 [Mycena kentingensis (nom. inval.)]
MPLALVRASTLFLAILCLLGFWVVGLEQPGHPHHHGLPTSTKPAQTPGRLSRLLPHVPRPEPPALPSFSFPIPFSDVDVSHANGGNVANHLFLVNDPEHTHPWTLRNEKAMQKLFSCLETLTCAQNQSKVILLASYHFRGALSGWDGGEDLWARSTIMSLESLGYTILYSTTPHLQRTVQLYQTLPNLISMVLLDVGDMMTCFNDASALCVKTNDNPDGIPAWKMFTFNWWEDSAHPLDGRWDLSPEAYPGSDHTYLGYSIEPSCAARKLIPHDARLANPQAYLMGKNGEYFSAEKRAWQPHDIERGAGALRDRAGSQPQVHFVAGIRQDGLPVEFAGTSASGTLKDLGHLHPHQFYEQLANSVALVGMGSPRTSPTPYDSLCLGVAFINPIQHWDRDYPTDRSRWVGQHETLKFLDPPYVYNVFVGDTEGFVDAIRQAVEHPFESFIPEYMRFFAIEERLGRIINTDWRRLAEDLMEERIRTGEGKIFPL